MKKTGARIDDAFPLSSLQQGMIFHSRQDTGLSVYHDVITFAVTLCWSAACFDEVLSYMVEKHPMLRTRFRLEKGRALQVVYSELASTVSVTDLSGMETDAQQQAIANWVENEKQQGIDLAKELWRISIFILNDQSIQFGLSMHHALMDGWSVASFSSELFALYQQRQQGQPLPALNPPPSYKHFIQAEQRALADGSQREYWASHFDNARVPWWAGSGKSASVRFTCEVTPSQSDAAVKLAARLGIQEKSLWCSVYMTLLSLLDGNDDVVGSVVTHGRPEMANAQSTLGLFLNALPVRADLTSLTWVQLLRQMDESLLEQYQHRHFPLVNIQMLTGLEFSASMFNFMNFHVYNGEKKAAVDAAPELSGFDETNYLFSVNVQKQQGSGRHLFVINAEPSVFDSAFRQRIHDYALAIIDTMLSSPDARIDKSALLPEKERHQLISAWNDNTLPSTGNQTLHQQVEAQAVATPDAVALDYCSGTLSYAALNRQANQLAHHLIAQGVTTEDRVGIYLPRGRDMMIAILAVLKAGACYVPLDPAYPEARIAYLQSDAQLAYLISHSDLPGNNKGVGRINLDTSWADIALAQDNPDVTVLPEQLAYVIYTSGSTGKPKGVALSHRGMLSLLAWAKQTLPASAMTGVLASTSMCFDLSVYEFFLPLTTGNTCILIDNILMWQEQAVRETTPVTLINTVPSAARALLEQNAIPASVEVINLAGEPLKPQLVDKLYAQTAVSQVYDLYGPSEDTTYSTGKLRVAGGPETIGKPVANTQAYILDAGRALCPSGVVGELYLSGDSLARGYLNRPAMTAERFVPNPFASTPGERMYATGDMVHSLNNEGELKYLGRADHQIKLRGFRIELGEIETALLRHTAVDDAVVVVDEAASGSARIVAYIAINEAEQVDIQTVLRQYLQSELPPHMVPSLFYVLEQLPLTPNGKVDRKALPSPDGQATLTLGGAPQGETERLLAALWRALLGADYIDRHVTFFSLGGNSLHVSRLALRIEELFGVRLPLKALFSHTTVQAQALAITQAQRQGNAAPVALRKRAETALAPVSFTQLPLCFFEQANGPVAAYNLPLALRLDGKLEVVHLEKAFNAILHRHSILRARVVTREDAVRQVIDPVSDISFVLQSTTEENPLAAIYQNLANRRFELENGQLVVAELVRESASQHVLMVNFHHFVCDGWSLGIFINELTTLYHAFSQGQPNPLLPLPLSYTDFAHWQREQDAQPLLSYWQEQLAGLPPLLSLPLDRPRPPTQQFRGAMVPVSIDRTLSGAIEKLCQKQGVTQFTLLLCAYAMILGKYSGQSDIAIGTPVANRHHAGTENLIGFFANTLVMRCDLQGNPRFSALLEKMQKMAVAGFAHQDMPFGQLVEAINPVRTTAHSPLFQVMFAFQEEEDTASSNAVAQSLKIEPVYPGGSHQHARFDLTLNLVPTRSGIQGGIEFNRDLFDASTIEQFTKQFTRLLRAITESPEQAISHYTLTDEGETGLLYSLAKPQHQRHWRQSEEHDFQQVANAGWCFVADVVSPEQILLCPTNVPGELLVSADVAEHYLSAEQLDSGNILQSPFGTETGRLYRTGMTARWCSDGKLEWLGSRDRSVKVAGYSVDLREIAEHVKACQGVGQAFVLACNLPSGERTLVAYLTPEKSDCTRDELIRSVKAELKLQLATYNIPTSFVVLDNMPLSASGQIDETALPTPETQTQQRQAVQPSTAEQIALCEIWQQVLNVPRIGIDDNFFALGGDSILSIQVASRAKGRGLRVTVKQIFEYQTIRELAQVVENETRVFSQAPAEGQSALLPVQHWLMQKPATVRGHFTQSLTVRAPDAMTDQMLRDIAKALVQRHDALRMTFNDNEGRFTPLGDISMDSVVHSHLLKENSADAIEKYILQTGNGCRQEMSLSKGPLFQIHYFRPQCGEATLLFIAHHLIVDGVSWRILLKDVQQGYTQCLADQPVTLPAKTSSVQARASELCDQAESEHFTVQRGFWQTQLDSPADAFPVDKNLSHEDLFAHAQRYTFSMDSTQSAALIGPCQEAYRTRGEELLVAAMLLAYQRWSGNTSLKVAMEGHGRGDQSAESDLSETVGWFTSLYPLHFDVPAYIRSKHDASLATLIKSVKEQMRSVPDAGVGFGALQYLSAAPFDQDHRVCPVLFNYLGNFTRSAEQDSDFPLLTTNSGADIGPEFTRDNWLDITGAVVNGQLSFTIGYNVKRHHTTSVTEFAIHMKAALSQLVTHCEQEDHRGFTPSDFPEAKLSQPDIDAMQARYPNMQALYPATPMQVGLIFHSLLDTSRQSYSTQMAFSLNGRLNVSIFQKAWATVAARHDTLRSAFVGLERESMLQLVVDHVDIPWQFHDLTDKTASEQEQAMSALCDAQKRTGFDLTQPAQMRMTLCRLAVNEYRWIWTHHHSILDGWSVAVLLEEVLDCYYWLCDGTSPAMRRDNGWARYIAWLGQQDRAAATTFWERTLADVNEPVVLPIDKGISGNAEDTDTFVKEAKLHGDEALTRQIVAGAKRYGVTVNTLVQAAWSYLLCRNSGQSVVTFGQTLSGRTADIPGIDSMVGLFIATVPVVTKVNAQQSLAGWLQTLQRAQSEREAFSYLPLEEIQACCSQIQGQGLFDTLLVFENFPGTTQAESDPESLSGAHAITLNTQTVSEGTNYGLTLLVAMEPALTLKLSYPPARFDKQAVCQLLQQVKLVLSAISTGEIARVEDIPYLDSDTRLKLIKSTGRGEYQTPEQAPLHALFEQQVAKAGHATAVVCGNHHVSYENLNRRANQLAHYLIEKGVRAESRVGICMQRKPDMIVAMLAVLKAGGCYVPVDPSYPQARISLLLEDSGLQLLLSESAVGDLILPTGVERTNLDTCALAQWPVGNPQINVIEGQLAYVIYTSGSTGRPKGVALTHASATSLITWARKQLAPDDLHGVLASTSICFDLSVYECFLPLCAGTTCVLIDDITCLADDEKIRNFPVTLINTVPSAAAMLVENKAIPATVRVINLAGEPLKTTLVNRLYDNTDVRAVYDLYGPSEDTTYSTWQLRQQNADATIGRPIANTQAYVLDRFGQLAAPGYAGELHLAGNGLARGYLDNPVATAQKFIPNPYSEQPGERLYATGDLTQFLPSGDLRYIGRIDHQIKLRGFRIELEEIERCLTLFPGVKEGVVIAHQPGTPQASIMAYVVREPEDDTAVTKNDDLLEHLSTLLPAHMVPAHIITLPHIPLTPNGKTDRNALPVPDMEQDEGELPETTTEIKLATLWCDLLHIDRVNRTDSFFQVGGNSVLAMRLIALISEEFDVDLAMKSLFDSPTIKAIASLIDYFLFDEFDEDDSLDSPNHYLELDL